MALLTKKPPYNLGVANSWRHLIYFQLAKPPNLEFPTFYHHLFDTVIPTPKIDPMWILLESIMTVWILFNGISMIGSMYPYNITILMGSDPAHGIRNMDPDPQFLWRQAHYTTPPLKTNMTLSGWNMTILKAIRNTSAIWGSIFHFPAIPSFPEGIQHILNGDLAWKNDVRALF